MTDARARFFLVAAVVSVLLVPVADPEHRWVAITLSVVYVLLALGSAFDRRARDRMPPRYHDGK